MVCACTESPNIIHMPVRATSANRDIEPQNRKRNVLVMDLSYASGRPVPSGSISGLLHTRRWTAS